METKHVFMVMDENFGDNAEFSFDEDGCLLINEPGDSSPMLQISAREVRPLLEGLLNALPKTTKVVKASKKKRSK